VMNLTKMEAKVDHDQNRDRSRGENADSLQGHLQILGQSADPGDHR
jgi:hypothetical protein